MWREKIMVNLNTIFGNITGQFQDLQFIMSEYYSFIYDKIVSLITIANQSGIYGHSDNSNIYDEINNFHYMFFYLYMIRKEYQEEIRLYEAGLISELITVQELADKYKLECIRKTMSCYGYNMIPVYELFDLNYYEDSSKDGIGYMALTPNTTNAPDNRVS